MLPYDFNIQDDFSASIFHFQNRGFIPAAWLISSIELAVYNCDLCSYKAHRWVGGSERECARVWDTKLCLHLWLDVLACLYVSSAFVETLHVTCVCVCACSLFPSICFTYRKVLWSSSLYAHLKRGVEIRYGTMLLIEHAAKCSVLLRSWHDMRCERSSAIRVPAAQLLIKRTQQMQCSAKNSLSVHEHIAWSPHVNYSASENEDTGSNIRFHHIIAFLSSWSGLATQSCPS